MPSTLLLDLGAPGPTRGGDVVSDQLHQAPPKRPQSLPLVLLDLGVPAAVTLRMELPADAPDGGGLELVLHAPPPALGERVEVGLSEAAVTAGGAEALDLTGVGPPADRRFVDAEDLACAAEVDPCRAARCRLGVSLLVGQRAPRTSSNLPRRAADSQCSRGGAQLRAAGGGLCYWPASICSRSRPTLSHHWR